MQAAAVTAVMRCFSVSRVVKDVLNSQTSHPSFLLSGDGKCVICDSYVRPCTLVRICDECNYGSYQGRCVICGGPGVSDAYYCKECTIQEKDVSVLQPTSLLFVCYGALKQQNRRETVFNKLYL